MIYPRIFIYIEAARGYYARYVGKDRTHQIVVKPDTRIEPYHIEIMRQHPNSWPKETS